MHYTLITGSSSGIGLSMAHECASRNMNLALVSLPGTGLEDKAREIEEKYNVDVRCLNIDLTEHDAPERVYRWCYDNNIQVNFLINNAGMAGTAYFPESSPEYCDKRIMLNIRALTLLCHYFIPMLTKNKKSYILNVGSLSAYFSIPYKTVYSASKSYVLNFSKSLSIELKPLGISVSVVCPNGVETNEGTYTRINSHKHWGKWTKIDSSDLAKIAIDKTLKGNRVIIPKFINKFLMLFGRMIPSFLKLPFLEREFRKEPPSP
ncbi:MAG: SDR family NAD(P)-dependent oxidoreductase [Bacteroidales bacterium]